jgi:hypothetical protein
MNVLTPWMFDDDDDDLKYLNLIYWNLI